MEVGGASSLPRHFSNRKSWGLQKIDYPTPSPMSNIYSMVHLLMNWAWNEWFTSFSTTESNTHSNVWFGNFNFL